MAKQKGELDYLGRGWNFPPTFDNQGRVVRMVEAEEEVRQSLQILLATHLGERVMQPLYGWEREKLMFEPITAGRISQMQGELEVAISFYESRITLDSINIDTSNESEGLIEIQLDYTIDTTNTRYNLVYPYYINETMNA